jgi:hypothetical protein
VTLVVVYLQVADLKTYGSPENSPANYYKIVFGVMFFAILGKNIFLE